MGRKKIQGECKDNPLELLPEKRLTSPHQHQANATTPPAAEPGKEHTLIQAINHLLTEVFYLSPQREHVPFEEMKGDSAVVKALNYLFVDDGEVNHLAC